MEDKRKDDFEIPSFVENKEPIDKSIFQLNDEKKVMKKEEYVPAHSENTAALRKRVAKEIEEVLETPNTMEEEVENTYEEASSQKTPLWIVVLSIVAILTAIVAAVLVAKDYFFSKPKPVVTPTPSPIATVMPSASPMTSPMPSSSPIATSSPSASMTPAPTSSSTTTTTSAPTSTSSPVINNNISSTSYVLQASMNVRTGPSTENARVASSDIPSAYRSSADGSVIREGTTVSVLEVRSNGNAKWGRIGDNAWICLDDGEQVFAKRK